MRYLPVTVFRADHDHDCTNNGVTAKQRDERLVVPHERGQISEDDLTEYGYTVLEYVDQHGGYFKQRGETRWSMFGGNFVWASDGRYRDQYGDRPIRVHDRVED